jgi:hypothetical protein
VKLARLASSPRCQLRSKQTASSVSAIVWILVLVAACVAERFYGAPCARGGLIQTEQATICFQPVSLFEDTLEWLEVSSAKS